MVVVNSYYIAYLCKVNIQYKQYVKNLFNKGINKSTGEKIAYGTGESTA